MQKTKEKQKKFLGTVPKKCQLVETFWDCPEISKTNNNGITLIVLIIAIIVILILVGVAINIALGEDEPEVPTVTLPEGLIEGSEFQMDADQDGMEETWIVLYDDTADHLNENEIEVISKNAMGELALGITDRVADTVAKEKATDIDGNDTVEDIEIAIYSYNNAIDTINNYCASLIKIDNLGVRSVGSLPSNPSYKNTNMHQMQNLDKWEDKTAWETYGILGEDADDNSDDDYNQMGSLDKDIRVSGNGESYWLASRDILGNWHAFSYGDVYFNVRYVSNTGYRNSNYLSFVDSYGNTNTFSPTNAVRPVIKLQYSQSNN